MRFLMVDAIQDIEPGVRATGIKNITLSEDFLAEHFPDRPIMPGVMILEALVQLADWLIRTETDFDMLAVPSSFDRVKFRRMVRPGAQLRLVVEVVEREDENVVVKASAFTGETLVASSTIGLALEPLKSYIDPDEARKMFALLREAAEEPV